MAALTGARRLDGLRVAYDTSVLDSERKVSGLTAANNSVGVFDRSSISKASYC